MTLGSLSRSKPCVQRLRSLRAHDALRASLLIQKAAPNVRRVKILAIITRTKRGKIPAYDALTTHTGRRVPRPRQLAIAFAQKASSSTGSKRRSIQTSIGRTTNLATSTSNRGSVHPAPIMQSAMALLTAAWSPKRTAWVRPHGCQRLHTHAKVSGRWLNHGTAPRCLSAMTKLCVLVGVATLVESPNAQRNTVDGCANNAHQGIT